MTKLTGQHSAVQPPGLRDAPPALRLTGLHKAFGEKIAVDHIDLSVPHGSFFGLVGPNGAGKTTALSMAVGLLRPDAGRSEVFGVDVWANPIRARELMGVLPDGLAMPERLTGREMLTFVGQLRGLDPATVRRRAQELLEVMGLADAERLALVIPQAERPDVRGRQWAFVLVFGPIAIVTAVLLTAVSGLAWAWPWVLALTPAVLGGSCGLLAVIWVAALVPGPDAHHRPDNPMDHGDATGPANLMFWTGLLPAAPPVGLLLAGTLLHNGMLRWAAVPVGIATGVLLAWWLGRVGSRRLERRGPELLTLMRTGRSTSRPPSALTVKLPRWKSVTVGVAWTIGCILTFPQGIVTAGMKLGGSPVRSWFLALYLPAPLQWPVCILMIALGVLILSLVTRMLWQARKAAP